MDNYEHDVLRLPDRYYIVGVRGSEHFEQVGWDLSWNKEKLASPQEKKMQTCSLTSFYQGLSFIISVIGIFPIISESFED